MFERDPVVLDHLGDVYMKLKMAPRALVSYKRALLLLEKKKRRGKREGIAPSSDEVELEQKVRRKIRSLNVGP